jgi:deoxyribodipyrimidine photo-lyase
VKALPTPVVGEEEAWVRQHLGHLCCDTPVTSPRFRGTQAAALNALTTFDVSGYASHRNTVSPASRRGASGLSPWIRHGLLSLPKVWETVEGPRRDVAKFRDELLWQEYARHVYARIGYGNRAPIRYQPRMENPPVDPWDPSMACVTYVMDELKTDGWMVNQTRMWMASQWSVRHGAAWQTGEDFFFQHLLDGSRAANRLGWQWTIGAGTGKQYGFSRWQVNKRAPGLCDTCTRKTNCPIESWPEDDPLHAVTSHPNLRSCSDPDTISGPHKPQVLGEADVVWITAESLGDNDPSLVKHHSLPVIFVFDERLLDGLRLSGKRLIFLAERLAELATSRELSVLLGDPSEGLSTRQVATTFAPVPGWARLASAIRPVVVHPWPWLRRPGSESIASFSAWRDTR